MLLAVTVSAFVVAYAPKPIKRPSEAEIKHLISVIQRKWVHISPQVDFRGPAARRLGEIGPPASEAIPALEKLVTLKDAGPDTKNAAREAIQKIKNPPQPGWVTRMLDSIAPQHETARAAH